MVDTPFLTLDRDNQPRSLATNQAVVDALGVLQTALTAAVNAPSGAQPLPTGAATQATLEAVRVLLAAPLAVTASALPLPAGAATQTTLAAVLSALGGTLAVSASALPLPAGAATSAGQTAFQTSLDRTTPGTDLISITPNDSTVVATHKALLVTVAGTLSVQGSSNTTVLLGNVTAGTILPLQAKRVMSTGTTATVVGIV